MNGSDFYHSERYRRRHVTGLEIVLGAVLLLLTFIAIAGGAFQ